MDTIREILGRTTWRELAGDALGLLSLVLSVGGVMLLLSAFVAP